MIMNRVEQSRPKRRSTALYALALFVLLLAQGLSRDAQAQQWETNGDHINNTNPGHVGIGTTAPQASLHVTTSSSAAGSRGIIDEQTSNDPNGALLIVRKSRGVAAVQNGDFLGNLFAQGFDGANWVNSSRLRFAVDGPVSAGSVPTALQFLTGSTPPGVERMRITSAGNVGIGTGTPNSLLHLRGVDVASVQLQGGSNFAGYLSAWAGGGFILSNNRDPRNGANHNPAIVGAQIILGNNGDGQFTDLVYQTTSAGAVGTPTELVRFKASGNVGIGTNAPTEKLHVVGNINVTGNINAKYQDVAEWVPSTQSLAAGTVVVLDTERSNHVVASSTTYDTRVAGVVSAQPGVLLGERGDGKLMVATTGRVKVRVDATRGPVRVGDLLVTSDREGLAMKSEPVAIGGRLMHLPGTLIGKALEPLEKGVGEILVLLSLQ
jgi:hypothetical protein